MTTINHKDKGRDIASKINRVLNPDIFLLQYVGTEAAENNKYWFNLEMRTGRHNLPQHRGFGVTELFFDLEGVLAIVMDDVEEIANNENILNFYHF